MRAYKYILLFSLLSLFFNAGADTPVFIDGEDDVFDQIDLIDQAIAGELTTCYTTDHVQVSPEKVKKKRLKYRGGCCEFSIIELPELVAPLPPFKDTYYSFPNDKVYERDCSNHLLRGPPTRMMI